MAATPKRPSVNRVAHLAPAQTRGAVDSRPMPPQELMAAEFRLAGRFVPAPEVVQWIERNILAEGGAIENPDHVHLSQARIGILWTTEPNGRAGRRIVGQAELMPPAIIGKWPRARAVQQIEGWFGEMPDFLITLDAEYSAACDDASWCALVEHELYHCGQERDEFGAPKFRKSGLPTFAMRAHDVEEFVGVVRRYGAAASNAMPIIEAARKPPEIAGARIAHACGTCLKVAA
jgi:hypothetical protein